MFTCLGAFPTPTGPNAMGFDGGTELPKRELV
jgi:hypothetical protein